MLVLLLLTASVVSAVPVAEPQLPFLPDVMNNHSFLDESASGAALSRFRSCAGSPELLALQKEILSSISAAEGRILRRLPQIGQDVLAKLAARLEGTVIDRPSVAEINKPIEQYLYGGDVMLSIDDLRRTEIDEDLLAFTQSIRNKRGAPVVTSRRWSKTQPIGFGFNSDIDEPTRQLIRTTTQKMAANTCLSFKENSNAGTQLQFLRGGGCYSFIGQQSASRQTVSIDKGCEFVRKDRDAFVSVNIGAVSPNTRHNFAKLSDAQNNNFGVPYDYGSDLHYGAFDFSTNGQAVLVASQGDYINTMGQRKLLTFNDFKMINLLYSCSANCPRQMVCQNGGYPSPKDCNACACSEFFTGTNCQTPKATISISAASPGTTSFHQDYNPTLYQSGNNYNWDMFGKDAVKIIRAPEGRKIRVTINQVFAAFGRLPCYRGCPFTGLEFVDNASGDLTTMGKIFCCAKDEKTSFISQSNVIGYKAYASPGMPFDGKVTYTVV